MNKRIFSTTIIAVLTFGLGWWLNGKYDFAKSVQKDTIHLDSLKSFNQKKQLHADTVFNDELELVIKETDGTIIVLRKFSPKKTFKDFTVEEKFDGLPPKELNFSFCKYGKLYKTASKEAADNGADFAGHYSFARMGCGTNCQVSTIIDLKTGNVYAGPEAAGGYDYKLDSRILIVNPPDSNGLYQPCQYCTPEQYLWTGSSFKRLE
jgi:uncharacterized lipoprotein NlpE involved in copper resistance